MRSLFKTSLETDEHVDDDQCHRPMVAGADISPRRGKQGARVQDAMATVTRNET